MMIGHLKKASILLVFALLAVLLFHGLTSINVDIGRHIQLGEIIWETKSVPTTNLFSYVLPDYPFVNHHWMAEVVFFALYTTLGFSSIIILKIILIILSIYVSWITFRSKKYLPTLLPLIFATLIIIERSEPRPEIFSFLFLAIYLFALFRAKYKSETKYLWYLPLIALLWVNTHIYFFVGPILIIAYGIDLIFARRDDFRFKKYLKQYLIVAGAIAVATLLNPNGLTGAFYPLTVLGEYGYSIVENQGIVFITNQFGFNLSIYTFYITSALLVFAFFLTYKKIKGRIFELLISAFFIFASFKMVRNLPLFAIGSIPIFTILLDDVQDQLKNKFSDFWKKKRKVIVIGVASIVSIASIVLIVVAVNNNFYIKLRSPKSFGLTVPNGAQRATDFINDVGLEGPVFNNFNASGFLLWQIYPEKVFVDNRPEAYPEDFFINYRNIQRKENIWDEAVEQYGFNYVFFTHHDITAWSQDFFKRISQDDEWPVVFLNEDIVIFAKRNELNKKIIDVYEITSQNAIEVIEKEFLDTNNDKLISYLYFGRVLNYFHWGESTVHFYTKAIEVDPTSAHAYMGLGFAYSSVQTVAAQEVAVGYIEKGIGLGLENSGYYVLLGLTKANTDDIPGAIEAVRKALELDPSNGQAIDLQAALEKI